MKSRNELRSFAAAFILFSLSTGVHPKLDAWQSRAVENRKPPETKSITLNQKAPGYRGIWYYNQKSDDEYVYKYSGGLGTYCAKHKPFAIYSKEANKTFFCYGGSDQTNDRLLHCVSYFDHKTGTVPRPTILLDKRTGDAHDNPVISIDQSGFIWIFSTSHGRSRPSFIHKSREPYRVDAFEQVNATYQKNGRRVPLTNFSYMQAWHESGKGFLCFFTRYDDPAARTNVFMTSPDGTNWSEWTRLAAIELGHYQVSAKGRKKIATAFNYHPDKKGLNWRTNLYYMESTDTGKTWTAVDGKPLQLPIKSVANAALVHDFRSEKKNIYLKDLRFDDQDRPVILFVVSGGYESGPKNAPRTWHIAKWSNKGWKIFPITTSDNNYDMGSLYLPANGPWTIVAPTGPGPQRFNPGGEIEIWSSDDRGETWNRKRQITDGSSMNHTYVRQPLDAHPDFVAFWADGHGRKKSESMFYFCNQKGEVFILPQRMEKDFERPQSVSPRPR